MKRNKNGLTPGWQPTEKQRRFVDGLMLGLNITDSAKQADCRPITFYTNWKNNPDFCHYLEGRRTSEALVKLPAVDRAVFKKAQEGDIAAAKLIYEVFGELRIRSLQLISNKTLNIGRDEYSKMTTAELKREAAKVAMELDQIASRDNWKKLELAAPIIDLDYPST